MIRSAGSPKRRKGSGDLEEEIGVWSSQGEDKDNFFFSLSPELMIMRESVPRQVDRESRGPQGERGLEFSRRKKGQAFFFFLFSTFLRII